MLCKWHFVAGTELCQHSRYLDVSVNILGDAKGKQQHVLRSDSVQQYPAGEPRTAAEIQRITNPGSADISWKPSICTVCLALQ